MTNSIQNLNNQTIVLASTAVGLITILGWYWYQRGKRVVPKIWKPVGTVKNLFVYPLKSGHRIEMKKALCTKYGIQMPKSERSFQFRDRSFLIYSEESSEFRTARQHPKLIFITMSSHGENQFTLTAPGMEPITVEIPCPAKNKKFSVTVHKGEKVPSIDCGDEVAQWLTTYVFKKDSGLRLGYFEGKKRRNINRTHGEYLKVHHGLGNDATGMYSDLTSYLLVNQASVDELSNRLPNENISVHNFRPNILMEGRNAPAYAEDDWKWIKIGDAVLYLARPCTRCIFTTINPETGVKSATNEPLRTMGEYRQLKQIKDIDLDGKRTVMGLNMGLQIEGAISVGDIVYVGKE